MKLDFLPLDKICARKFNMLYAQGTIVVGETLAARSPAVDAVGIAPGVDMADWREADPAFFDLIRDREVLVAMLGEIGGRTIADAREKTKVIESVIADHLCGENGRPESSAGCRVG